MSILEAMGFSIVLALGVLYKASYIDGSDLPQEVIQNQHTFQLVKENFKQPDYFERCAQNEEKCVFYDRSAAGFRGVSENLLKWVGADYVAFAQKNYEEYCVESGITCQKPKRKESGSLFKSFAPAQTTVILPIFYYPGWKVSMEGEHDMSIATDEATGLMAINLPPGDHIVTLYWSKTPIEILVYIQVPSLSAFF